MKTIRHTTTLFYYDGPQIFEARDAIGGHYIAVMVEPESGAERYLVAGVEPERLRQFRRGMIDLRSLLLERPIPEWHLARAHEASENDFVLEPQTGSLEESGLLPESGFVLRDQPARDATGFSIELPPGFNLKLQTAETGGGYTLKLQTVESGG